MPYFKEIFNASNLEHAKDIVLSPDANNPSKFSQETKFTVDFLEENKLVNENTKVLDFGCGMGRVSKEVIDRFNCSVIGVDFSEKMLEFANEYVSNTEKFETHQTYTEPNSVDLVLSILVLQHVEDPFREIDNICSILKPGGKLVLLNEPHRFVPVDVDRQGFVIWNNDNVNVFVLIESKLRRLYQKKYFDSGKFIYVYEKV